MSFVTEMLQMSQAIMESKRHERELLSLQELVKEKVQTIAELRGLETSYQEAVRKNDELAGKSTISLASSLSILSYRQYIYTPSHS